MQIKIPLSILASLFVAILCAQPKINSPLSRLGIGDNYLNQGHHLNMMGGLYGGFADDFLPNVKNPASLGFLKVTAFDFGLTAGQSNVETTSESDKYTLGSLEHLTLAFPLRNTISEILERQNKDYAWSMAFDLRANTRIGYNIAVQDSLPDIGKINRTYKGTGGTYTFGWSNAYRYKSLSVGLDMGVIFGNVSTYRTAAFEELIDPSNDLLDDNININGFRWNLGAQYRLQLNKEEENDSRKRYLTAGIYGNLSQNFKSKGEQLYRGVRFFAGIRDTIVDESDIEGKGTLPGRIGLGVVYEPDLRWQLGINFEMSDWTNYESDFFDTGDFGTAMTIGVGLSYVPDADAFGKYFQRVAYKGGFQFVRDGREFNGDPVQAIQANIGMTLPFYYLRQVSHVHVGIEYKRTTADILTQQYIGINFGATFNDNTWFLKRKFD
jgi:hypothetical protein